MASNKSKNPFKISPEKELKDRLKNAKPLSREEFVKRLQESREERVKGKQPASQVTDTNLILTFNVPDGSDGWPGGTTRTKSVSGDWTFTFTK
jgi:hypothetical protein